MSWCVIAAAASPKLIKWPSLSAGSVVPCPPVGTLREDFAWPVHHHLGQGIVVEEAPQRFEVALQHACFRGGTGRRRSARRGDDGRSMWIAAGHGFDTRGAVRSSPRARLSIRRKS